MKTVVEQLTEAQAEMLTLKASVTSLTADVAKSKETIAAMQVTIDAAAADKTAMETAHAAAIKDITGKLDTDTVQGYYAVEDWQCYELDYPEDIPVVECLMDRMILKGRDAQEVYHRN
jgi:predicted  nucleic acid-binding Zn-ribbon protein